MNADAVLPQESARDVQLPLHDKAHAAISCQVQTGPARMLKNQLHA